MSSFLKILGCSLAAITFIGCGGSGEPVVEVITINGTVTYEGAPVTEGSIQFEDSSTGISSSAELGADGAYSLESATGDYKVTVTPPWIEIDLGPDSPPEEDYKEVDNIPQKYRQSNTTDLTAKVTEDGQTIDFDLKP
jgi:hypothetical protein